MSSNPKNYAQLEQEHGVEDKLAPEDYKHAVRLLDEDFKLTWEEIQRWQPDMFEHYMLKQLRLMEQMHEVVEQGLKILLKIRGQFIDRPPKKGGDKHHNLLQLYNKICDLDQGIVRRQFEIYVSLYDHIDDASVEQYLKKWGDERLYIRNRLAAVEAVGRSAENFAQQHEEMHPWVMAEVAHALVSILEAKAQFDHGFRTIYDRLDDAIQHIFLRDSYEVVIQAEPAEGGSSVNQMMQSLVREKGGWINTAVHLIRHEIISGDPYLRAWLVAAKGKIQAASTLDMRLFVARALREELRWDVRAQVFTTVGEKYEAYTVFDEDASYVLSWIQGDQSGRFPLRRGEVPDWRREPKHGAQISLYLENNEDVRHFAETVERAESTDFVLTRSGERKMSFVALLITVSGGSWGPREEMDVLDLKEVTARLIVCNHGDGYGDVSMLGGEHGTLPYSWIEYRPVVT